VIGTEFLGCRHGCEVGRGDLLRTDRQLKEKIVVSPRLAFRAVAMEGMNSRNFCLRGWQIVQTSDEKVHLIGLSTIPSGSSLETRDLTGRHDPSSSCERHGRLYSLAPHNGVMTSIQLD
jgi:hypothetical protein